MTATKNVYALMLALVIVLSGCFGMAGDESDAQDSGSDDDSNSGETGSTHSGADNLPPVISVSVSSCDIVFFYEGSDCTTAGISVKARHAMTDWDGTIQQAGWDIDLDGTIDYNVTADEGYTILQMPMSAMIWSNTSGWDENDGAYGYSYLQNSVAFGAQDDDGEFVSSAIYIIQKLAYVGFSGSTNSSYLDDIPCDGNPASPATTSNIFTAEDASASTSAATDDLLMQVRWSSALDNLSWDYVQITLSVGNSTYICNTAGDVECSIGQDGSDDAMWETGEFLTISESGSAIADGATTISIHITYNSQTVAGPSSVSVS